MPKWLRRGRPVPDNAGADRRNYLSTNAREALFIEADRERLIPQHEFGAGALAAAVPDYPYRRFL
jgi:hypothetical protein